MTDPTPEDVAALFTRPDGSYAFARWTRPIAPIVFGIDDPSLDVVKQAIEATVFAAGHRMIELDPELGANLMIFFLRDWSELTEVPSLEAMLPDLPALVETLQSQDATQYRTFRFDPAGGIRAAFVFLRMTGGLAVQPAADLGLEQAVKALLTWAPGAFAVTSPLALPPDGGPAILRPGIAALLTAAYDPVMPDTASDASHALRLAARLPRGG